MKHLTALGLMLISFTSFAADPQMQMMGMDPAKMQEMQKAMVEMQNCMQKIDKSGIEKIKRRGEAMKQEIKSLCKAGKRSAAQSKAIAYSKEIMNSREMVQMRKCSEKIHNLMPDSANIDQYDADTLKNKNVCDEIK